MFSMDDIDNVDNNHPQIPKELMDNTEFLSSLVSITNLIERLDFTDDGDRTRFQLHIINMITNGESLDERNTIYTALALSAHLSLLFISLQQSESKESYVEYFRKLVVEPLFEDEGNIKCSTEFRPPEQMLIANKKYKFTSVRQPCGKPLVGSSTMSSFCVNQIPVK